MVTCSSKVEKYWSTITNGTVTIDCDNPEAYGGRGLVFGPHDFIEAAYAACLCAGTRKICEREGIEHGQIRITAALDYHDEERMYIRYKIEIDGISRELELDIAAKAFENCLVKKNLLKKLVFEPLEK